MRGSYSTHRRSLLILVLRLWAIADPHKRVQHRTIFMKYILVLEDESGFKKDLLDILKSIDPQLAVRFFDSLADFHDWMKVAMIKGPLALAEGDVVANEDDELRMIISKNEMLGTHNMDLIKKTLEFLIRKKFCIPEMPTSFVLTAFDSPDFNVLDAENSTVDNVLFKPFDKLIVKQHLEFALSGHQPLDGSTLSAIEVKDSVEMLKRGQYESLSEIGFTSVSNIQMNIGGLTKYYADIFQAEARKSLYAYCISSVQKGPEEFANEFHFFAAENPQISRIRGHINQSSQVQTAPIFKKAGQPMNVLVLSDNAAQVQDLKTLLQDKFARITVFAYPSVEKLHIELGSIPPDIHCVFANFEMFEIDKAKTWSALCAAFHEEAKKRGTTLAKDPDLFILAKKKISPELFPELFTFAKDVYFAPLDRNYVMKKFSTFYDNLALQKSASVSFVTEQAKLKIAALAKIKQVSEAGLVMNYHRRIEIGSFREFMLIRESESDSPEIAGICNYNEEHKEGQKNVTSNHFIFFGMRDHFLKHIRLWIRETYIRQKGEEP